MPISKIIDTAVTTELDLWTINADHTTNATITTWTRPSHIGYAKAGTGMTHSSGIFTFPSTGLWKISLALEQIWCLLIPALAAS